MKIGLKLGQLSSLCLLAAAGMSVEARTWSRIDAPQFAPEKLKQQLRFTEKFTAFELVDPDALYQSIANAPRETEFITPSGVLIELPRPDGTVERFRIWENDTIGEQVRSQVPGMRTYSGQGIDDPSLVLRADMGPQGFHAAVFGKGAWYFVPITERNESVWAAHLVSDRTTDPVECLHDLIPQPMKTSTGLEALPATSGRNFGTVRRTYRLALNGTIEYTAALGGTGSVTASGNANFEATRTVNNVDAVYERDLCISLNLTYLKCWTGADPFTNGNGVTMLTENGPALNSTSVNPTAPGLANYDIGHVFSTGGGGVASYRSVGSSTAKWRGVTGQSFPTGPGFDIDYVAHEMGHQFGGSHSFNGTTDNCGGGNRSATAAWEPGSGTTIMAYAGICGVEDVQSNSDPYFHGGNINEIMTWVQSTSSTANSSAVTSSTGNGIPTVNAGVDGSVPIQTAFRLNAVATDPNSNSLTYCWEQLNTGTASPTTDNTTRALFRSFNPTTSSVRYFPSWSLALAGNMTSTWELAPTVARSMTFRCTVRDNVAGGGAVRWDDINVAAVGTTSFQVTAPNTAVSLAGLSTTSVTWTAGFSTVSTNVNIYLSTNSGTSYQTGTATLLLGNTPNDGSQAVTIPNTPGTTNRIIVEGVSGGATYFDVSNANFTITSTAANVAPVINTTSVAAATIPEEALFNRTVTATDANAGQTITFSLSGAPSGMTINPTSGVISWTPSEAQGPGTYNFSVIATDNGSPALSDTEPMTVNVTEVNKVISGTFLRPGDPLAANAYTTTVQLWSGSTLAQSWVTTMNTSGVYSVISTVAPGTYNVWVKPYRWLAKRVNGRVVTSTGNAVPTMTSAGYGDIDDDNEVGPGDLQLVLDTFGGNNPAADLDGDAEVGPGDLQIVLDNFGLSGDTQF